MRRPSFTLLAAAVVMAASAPVLGQNRVRTEIIHPPKPAPAGNSDKPADDATITGTVPADKALAAAVPSAAVPTILTDVAALPAPVARMRERILAAARSGRLDQLVAVMQSGATMPIFSLNDDKNPISYWKTNYPDSAGVEILATLIDVLEAGYVHVDEGTPQEMYLWPYFARMPLKALTAEQKVELFKIVTGADYRDMLDFGAYNFYRVGISRDGTWHFFVTGD